MPRFGFKFNSKFSSSAILVSSKPLVSLCLLGACTKRSAPLTYAISPARAHWRLALGLCEKHHFHHRFDNESAQSTGSFGLMFDCTSRSCAIRSFIRRFIALVFSLSIQSTADSA